MKKMFIRSGIVVLFLMSNHFVKAQFTLDGQLRPRFEHRDGYKTVATPDQNPANFIQQRTRLNFGYTSEGYKFKVVLQDVRVWGSQPQLVSDDGALTTLHEAWGEAFVTDNFALKFGRQEIAYDDHRIFGTVGWAQQARSHDAAILKYKTDLINAHAGFAYNQDAAGLTETYAVNGSYKAFQYLWMNIKPSDNFNASVLFLNNGKQAEKLDSLSNVIDYKDNYSQTLGTRLTYKTGDLIAHGEFYKQMGVMGDWDETELDAMLFGADVGSQITSELKATIGYQYLSGQSQTDSSSSYQRIQHAFTPFYGTNHKFNGHMDYFYVGNHTNSVGLQDIFLKIKYVKKDKFSVGLDAHIFYAAADVYDPVQSATTGKIESMDKMLGTELDFSFGVDIAKGVHLKTGYSHMFDTETLASLKSVTYETGTNMGIGRNDQMNSWAWLMITINTTFISPKKD